MCERVVVAKLHLQQGIEHAISDPPSLASLLLHVTLGHNNLSLDVVS